jgi:hypothetical protein
MLTLTVKVDRLVAKVLVELANAFLTFSGGVSK